MDVALSNSAIFIINQNQELMSFGANIHGILGKGNKHSDFWEDEATVILQNVTSISCSLNSAAAIQG